MKNTAHPWMTDLDCFTEKNISYNHSIGVNKNAPSAHIKIKWQEDVLCTLQCLIVKSGEDNLAKVFYYKLHKLTRNGLKFVSDHAV